MEELRSNVFINDCRKTCLFHFIVDILINFCLYPQLLHFLFIQSQLGLVSPLQEILVLEENETWNIAPKHIIFDFICGFLSSETEYEEQ